MIKNISSDLRQYKKIFFGDNIMTIERTEDEIIIRIPSNIYVDDIQDMVDLIKFREISSKSKATQEQIDELSKEVSKSIWKKMVSERATA